MKTKKTKVLTARLTVSLVDKVQQTAEAQHVGVSELLRRALVAYLKCDPETRRHRETMYEIVKTRALVLRMLDRELTEPEVNQLLSLAEGDAKGYVAERET